MREIDTDALRLVAPTLGVGNPATATRGVLFDDENLQQVMEVTPEIRRAATIAPTSGVFGAAITNTHGAAGQIVTTRDPYDLAVASGAGWPDPIPDELEVWLLSGHAAAAVNVADETLSQRLELRHPATHIAFGASGTLTQLVQLFQTEVPISAAVAYLAEAGSGVAGYRGPAWRITRGSLIVWATQAEAAGDITTELVLGLFPTALSHDARTG